MVKKERFDPKRESLLKEREDLLKDVDAIDAILGGKFDQDESAFAKHTLEKLSLRECINWLQPFIQHSLSDIPDRLDRLTIALEQEFPLPDLAKGFSQDVQDKLFDRVKAYTIIKLFIDSALILFALGRNGAAIIELHSVLERQAIEKLANLLLSPVKVEIGQRVIDRLTLQDATSMLLDCGILDKSNIKFAERLSKLRNGLAHRNPQKIANAVLSGQKIEEVEIESVISEVDFIPYAVKSIRFLMKVLNWLEEVE